MILEKVWVKTQEGFNLKANTKKNKINYGINRKMLTPM